MGPALPNSAVYALISDGLEYTVRTDSLSPPSDYTLAGSALTAGLICTAIL